MRTNIDIDDALLAEAMRAGPYTTKKETVEAGLRLLARQAAYREILKWEGKLQWEGDESIDWTQPATDEAPISAVHEPGAAYGAVGQAPFPATRAKAARRAGR
ncbi:MAG: type II toxin-antitoxin system VapB family antitoxin [Proteobacteria bacterium]|nr:type II toxin-antitoxin system VapB family antitoxin [Pseudomonadota bacterium]